MELKPTKHGDARDETSNQEAGACVDVDLNPIYRCVAALDVHQKKLTVCVLLVDETGRTQIEIREFGGFKRDRREMAQWVASFHPEQVVMESTGVYWKSPYAALEHAGIRAVVVNAYHVKNTPGRKTDIADAQWLAMLARAGLLKPSFVPPAKFRELRLISRQMQNFTAILSGEKNRLHKLLTDGGIRLSAVISDIHGKSGRAMIVGLLNAESPKELLQYADKRLRASEEELLDALDGDLSESHLFIIAEVLNHIEEMEGRIAHLRQHLFEQLRDCQALLQLLHTLPGIDETAAAMLLVEIGDDMSAFGSPERLAAWAGVCPGNNESAGKRKAGKKRKGNPYVRRILCEAANALSRTRCALQDKFKALSVRRGRKRAIFAIAHKLLKLTYILIDRREHYRDASVDYDALVVERNAPRWMRALKKYGYLPA